MRKFWTTEEINLLKQLYEHDGYSLIEIVPIFNEKFNRTKPSIFNKINKLKLKHSTEQISKIKQRLNSGEKNGMFGIVSVNKGLNKNNSDRIKKASKKISKTRKKMYKLGQIPSLKGEGNPMFGKKSWNHGLTKHTDDRIKKASKKLSKTRKKIWESFSEDEKNEKIGKLTEIRNLCRKDTKIEIIIKNILENLNINFIKNYRKDNFVFDFWLTDYNLIIECNGDYWHGNDLFFKKLNETQIKNRERDQRKISYINDKKMEVIILWEHEILYNLEEVKNILWQRLVKK